LRPSTPEPNWFLSLVIIVDSHGTGTGPAGFAGAAALCGAAGAAGFSTEGAVCPAGAWAGLVLTLGGAAFPASGLRSPSGGGAADFVSSAIAKNMISGVADLRKKP